MKTFSLRCGKTDTVTILSSSLCDENRYCLGETPVNISKFVDLNQLRWSSKPGMIISPSSALCVNLTEIGTILISVHFWAYVTTGSRRALKP